MDTPVFAALADTSRLRIVELLRDRPHTVNEVALALQIRQPQASKHLKALREAGFVKAQKVAQKRLYALEQDAFVEMEQWLLTFGYHIDNQLNRLDTHINQSKGA